MIRLLAPLFFIIPAIIVGQDLPDEDWFCNTQNPFQVSSDVGNFEIVETPSYIFNPMRGVREYDNKEFYSSSCRENVQAASFICSSTLAPDVELLFHFNTVSKTFNYVRSIMSKRGGNTVVTILGICSKL